MVSVKQTTLTTLAALGAISQAASRNTAREPSLPASETRHCLILCSSPLAPVALLVMHAEQDYATSYPCYELPARGYTTLYLNNRGSKSGGMNDLAFEDMMADVGTGVEFLRNYTEIDQVVLWVHSGGDAMMAAYQNIAEKGASACNRSEKTYP
ncbi:hypothetical protein diail_4271 [Diaporthe ilicicola]|nr:hypothetical protein diail_4271 [Diaporthe ilicicola]